MIEREELGLLAACYTIQYLAEGSELHGAFPEKWRCVGRAVECLGFPRKAALRYFEKWKDRGWLDDSYADPYRCKLTQGGHIAAQQYLTFKPIKYV